MCRDCVYFSHRRNVLQRSFLETHPNVRRKCLLHDTQSRFIVSIVSKFAALFSFSFFFLLYTMSAAPSCCHTVRRCRGRSRTAQTHSSDLPRVCAQPHIHRRVLRYLLNGWLCWTFSLLCDQNTEIFSAPSLSLLRFLRWKCINWQNVLMYYSVLLCDLTSYFPSNATLCSYPSTSQGCVFTFFYPRFTAVVADSNLTLRDIQFAWKIQMLSWIKPAGATCQRCAAASRWEKPWLVHAEGLWGAEVKRKDHRWLSLFPALLNISWAHERLIVTCRGDSTRSLRTPIKCLCVYISLRAQTYKIQALVLV